MKYMDMLKSEFSEKRPGGLLPKLPKGAFDSKGSALGGHISEIERDRTAGNDHIQGEDNSLKTAPSLPVKTAKSPRYPWMDRLLIDACHGLDITPQDIYRALSDEDLADLAARRISLDELHTFAVILCERRGMEKGVIPKGWTEIASCAGCGPVYLWTSGEFAGCPWCHVRAKGVKIPHPDTEVL